MDHTGMATMGEIIIIIQIITAEAMVTLTTYPPLPNITNIILATEPEATVS
jgi:hypothetical protein